MARKKNVKSLEKAIKTIEKAAESIEDATPGDNQFLHELPDIDSSELEIQELFDALPNTNDFYLKIYKRKPLPLNVKGPEFKEQIFDISSIQDIEVTVRDMARDNNWGPGEYEVRALRKCDSPLGGRPRHITKPAIMLISYDQVNKEGKPQASFDDEFNKRLKFAKELYQSQGNSSDFTKALAETFKTSVETITKLMPTPNNGNSNQAMAVEIIKSLKDLGVIGKETNKPITIEDIVKLIPVAIAAIKETGIFRPKPEKDLLVEIAKLRESGIIKFSGDEKGDPIDSVSKVVDIIAALNPLMDRNESGSIGVELIRTLGPSVPKIVEDVTGTIRDVAEVARLKLARQMNVPPEYLRPRIPENTQSQSIEQNSPGTPPQPIPTNQPTQPQETKMNQKHPIIQKILDAIDANNKEFFPELKQNILIFVGAQAIESLISGELKTEAFLVTISETLKEPDMNTEKARIYLDNFVDWMKDEIEKNIVAAKCEKCGEEYEMSSDEWEKDDKICSKDCDGKLLKIE